MTPCTMDLDQVGVPKSRVLSKVILLYETSKRKACPKKIIDQAKIQTILEKLDQRLRNISIVEENHILLLLISVLVNQCHFPKGNWKRYQEKIERNGTERRVR